MSETPGDGLLDRLELIEQQPLEMHAAGYVDLAEKLAHDLQSGDAADSAEGLR